MYSYRSYYCSRGFVSTIHVSKSLHRSKNPRPNLWKGHCTEQFCFHNMFSSAFVALLFYVHGKHLRSCRDGQLT